MIHFENVGKRYAEGGEALSGIDLQMDAGEIAFLTGHSGAGKSTMLKLIGLIERASYGQVIVNGKNFSKLGQRHIPYVRRDIGIIFQNHKLLNDRTVFDNVALPLVIAGEPHRDIQRRVRASLDKVGLLDKERMRPVALSGGEQQRVGIARAVVNKPPLLIADEPTGNLDPQLSAEIMNLFAEFNQVGVTVLIASHDIDLIMKMGKRILVLDKGRLINVDAPENPPPHSSLGVVQ